MADITKLDITKRHPWRGMIRASITRLGDKVENLETKELLSPVDWLCAKTLQQRLNDLDVDFRSYHFTIIKLLQQ